MLILFKACPRCNGDLHVNSDMYGRYVECLQCGYLVEYSEELVATLTDASDEREFADASVASQEDAA